MPKKTSHTKKPKAATQRKHAQAAAAAAAEAAQSPPDKGNGGKAPQSKSDKGKGKKPYTRPEEGSSKALSGREVVAGFMAATTLAIGAGLGGALGGAAVMAAGSVARGVGQGIAQSLSPERKSTRMKIVRQLLKPSDGKMAREGQANAGITHDERERNITKVVMETVDVVASASAEDIPMAASASVLPAIPEESAEDIPMAASASAEDISMAASTSVLSAIPEDMVLDEDVVPDSYGAQDEGQAGSSSTGNGALGGVGAPARTPRYTSVSVGVLRDHGRDLMKGFTTMNQPERFLPIYVYEGNVYNYEGRHVKEPQPEDYDENGILRRRILELFVPNKENDFNTRARPEVGAARVDMTKAGKVLDAQTRFVKMLFWSSSHESAPGAEALHDVPLCTGPWSDL